MRLGVVVLPELPWSQAAEQWRRLDDWGYHSAWTYDHLAWRSLADGPWFATVPTLAAAALVTRPSGSAPSWRRRTSGTRCRSPRS